MKYAREYRRYEKVYKFFFRAGGVFACLMGFAGLVSGLTSFV